MFIYFQISSNIIHRIKWNTSSSLTTNPHTTVAFNQDQVETWCNLTEMLGSGAKWHQTVMIGVLTCTCNLFVSLVWRDFFENNWHPIKRRHLRARWCVWTFASQYGLCLPLRGEHWKSSDGLKLKPFDSCDFILSLPNHSRECQNDDSSILFWYQMKGNILIGQQLLGSFQVLNSVEFPLESSLELWFLFTWVGPLGPSGFYPGSNLSI